MIFAESLSFLLSLVISSSTNLAIKPKLRLLRASDFDVDSECLCDCGPTTIYSNVETPLRPGFPQTITSIICLGQATDSGPLRFISASSFIEGMTPPRSTYFISFYHLLRLMV